MKSMTSRFWGRMFTKSLYLPCKHSADTVIVFIFVEPIL